MRRYYRWNAAIEGQERTCDGVVVHDVDVESLESQRRGRCMNDFREGLSDARALCLTVCTDIASACLRTVRAHKSHIVSAPHEPSTRR
jgi:hypothetical protein